MLKGKYLREQAISYIRQKEVFDTKNQQTKPNNKTVLNVYKKKKEKNLVEALYHWNCFNFYCRFMVGNKFHNWNSSYEQNLRGIECIYYILSYHKSENSSERLDWRNKECENGEEIWLKVLNWKK